MCTPATSYLPWENEQQFNDLHQALQEEYYPDGVSEEAAVFELASLYWKRRRLSIGTQLAFHGQPDTDALAKAGNDGWKGVARYLKKASEMAIASVTRFARRPPRTRGAHNGSAADRSVRQRREQAERSRGA